MGWYQEKYRLSVADRDCAKTFSDAQPDELSALVAVITQIMVREKHLL